MAKYRKKPVIIDAKQVELIYSDGDTKFTDGSIELFPMNSLGIYIETLEGNMYFGHDDWIITGIKGERYPCKPDIFAASYELV